MTPLMPMIVSSLCKQFSVILVAVAIGADKRPTSPSTLFDLPMFHSHDVLYAQNGYIIPYHAL